MLVFIILFYTSILGMFFLIVVKRWELRTGRVLASRMRPFISRMSMLLSGWVDGVLPGAVRVVSRRSVLFFREVIRHITAHAVLWFEGVLESALRSIKRVTTPARQGGAPASHFLREVAEHKKMLMRESGKDVLDRHS